MIQFSRYKSTKKKKRKKEKEQQTAVFSFFLSLYSFFHFFDKQQQKHKKILVTIHGLRVLLIPTTIQHRTQQYSQPTSQPTFNHPAILLLFLQQKMSKNKILLKKIKNKTKNIINK